MIIVCSKSLSIPDLGLVYAICLSPLARELKGTNDSCSTDGSALCERDGLCLKEDRRVGVVGALRLTPNSSQARWRPTGSVSRQVNSLREGACLPALLSTC